MLRSGKRSLKRMRLVQAAGNGGAALDFDGQETPVGQFDDEVDLEAVEIAEVVQASKGCHSCRQDEYLDLSGPLSIGFQGRSISCFGAIG